MEKNVEVTREGRVGRIRLNRGAALNALDLAMLRAIGAALGAFRDQPTVHAVVVDSTSQRAFCAGGDIRVMRGHALAGDDAFIHEYFAAEYA
ncbi:MAG: enoyl-CoA hydratase/isomerase family protein, partial [Acetobacteraceae bacterium]